MQTILGAGGTIANQLARELTTYTNKIRLVSRKPKKVNETDALFAADLLDAGQTAEAVAGSTVVYLTAGLPYKTRIWQAQWPAIMRNVIRACAIHQARLVFFDNVYMYGLIKGTMSEETPFRPVSRKGQARAETATLLVEAMQEKKITALLARSADFFGANTQNSIFNSMVVDKLKAGKKAQLMVSGRAVHGYTFTKDAARATALLGNTESAFGQTWHLPVSDSHTGKEFVNRVATVLNVKPAYSVTPRWALHLLAPFIPPLKESMEMLYQFEYDYHFSDTKFTKAFPQFSKTSFEDIIRQMDAKLQPVS
jgi:nucleoside-diphosphate-sugar epimerase